MKRRMLSILAVCFLCSLATQGVAQKQNNEPPRVLWITHEEFKPFQDEAYQRLQEQYADLFSRSNLSHSWLGLTPLTGKSNEGIFIMGLNSVASIEGALKEISKLRTGPNRQRINVLDKQAEQLLTGRRTAISLYRPDMSLGADAAAEALFNASHLQVTTVRLRPGGEQEWASAVADCVQVLKRSNVAEQYLVYQVISGDANGTFLVLYPTKSIAELDKVRERELSAISALGADKVQKLSRVMSQTFLNEDNTLYAVSFRSGYSRK